MLPYSIKTQRFPYLPDREPSNRHHAFRFTSSKMRPRPTHTVRGSIEKFSDRS